MKTAVKIIVFIFLVNTMFLTFSQSSWLRILIEGLPEQPETAIVIVSSLNGNAHYLSKSILLGNISAGPYVIGSIPTAVGGRNFIPDPMYTQVIQVNDNQLSEMVITYKSEGSIPNPTPNPTPTPTPNPTPTPTPTPTPSLKSKLLICELTSGPIAAYYSAWLELYNPTNETINLAGYQLRSPAGNRNDPNDRKVSVFAFPNHNIPPKSYLLVRARANNILVNSSKQIYIENGADVPRWQSYGGALELLSGSQTVDFIRWGINEDTPATANAWQGENISTAQVGQVGSSFARDQNCTDTNQASDWRGQFFATPAGPNDVPVDAKDLDNDGIPDSAEVKGSSFAGLDLFAMGARINQPDIFIEIDVMENADEGTQPRQEALDKVVKAFAKENIAIHFDIGSFYTNSSSLQPKSYNLGNRNVKVPYNKTVELSEDIAFLQGRASFYTYKSQYLDAARVSIFHYLLMGSSRMLDGSAGSAGAAELNGNDIIITLGNWGLNSKNQKNTNILINYQAANIMHELGHNLGLGHGGKDATNMQPNHLSIMNYLYTIEGIGPSTGQGVGDRYYQYKGWKNISRCDLVNSSCTDKHIIDFSHGKGRNIDENAINEGTGIGYGFDWVDYNNDNQESVITKDINFDNKITVLEDFDDWSFINIPFQRSFGGAFSLTPFNITPRQPLVPMSNDFQPSIVEDVPPASFFINLYHDLGN